MTQGKTERTWFDNIHDVYMSGLKRTKNILHDKSLPWDERERRCLEALVEIKKMMRDCRPQELRDEALDPVMKD